MDNPGCSYPGATIPHPSDERWKLNRLERLPHQGITLFPDESPDEVTAHHLK
jgi:hypothetical protein